jgi:hypothetical protein
MTIAAVRHGYSISLFYSLKGNSLSIRNEQKIWECPPPIHLFDKNSLLGEMNIRKGQLCVKGILAQDLGVVLGAFWGGELDGFRE